MQVKVNHKSALQFVILFGLISFFADMTYESARSITGPYLAILHASATTVGIVAGFGELIGYVLRLFSGYWVDRSHRYWLITIIGYAVNLIAVPLLALAGNWQIAALLIITERAGKAIRAPARDTLLSYASQSIGMGKGFGIHQAMDQAGAMLGPALIALLLYKHASYHYAFAWLAVPAICALFILVFTALRYPHPQQLEIKRPTLSVENLTKTYWLYVIGACLLAAGYADFPLIAFHFEKIQLMSASLIPLSYAIAMGSSALTSLVAGRFYDRFGLPLLAGTTFFAAFFAPLVFSHSLGFALFGMVLWGIGMGSQSTLIKAAIGNLIPQHKRGSAYGLIDTLYGVSWFIGSALMGWLYDHSISAIVLFSLLLQLAAIPFFFYARQSLKML